MGILTKPSPQPSPCKAGRGRSKKGDFLLKIAMVGTLWLNTPPQNYGGTENVLYHLTNGLVDRGHDVTFFGPSTARVKAKIIPTIISPLRDMNVSWNNFTYTLFHMTEVFDMAKKFDIIHLHINKAQDYVSFPFSVYKNIPSLFTLHFYVPDEHNKPDRYRILQKYKYLPYSSISESQQKDNLNYIANVYNGIDISQYPFVAKPKDYFVWLGKITPIKGTKEAILVAKKAGVQLYILGVVDHGVPSAYSYFKHEVEPLIDNKQIVFYEAVGLPEKAMLLGNAKALLNPIQWEEPFGLVMIEAQSTGTPVIALNRGAAPEVIQNRQTGFVVNSLDDMVEAIKKVETIDRTACRNFVETTFSITHMVEGYEKAYDMVRANWPTYYKNQVQSVGGKRI